MAWNVDEPSAWSILLGMVTLPTFAGSAAIPPSAQVWPIWDAAWANIEPQLLTRVAVHHVASQCRECPTSRLPMSTHVGRSEPDFPFSGADGLLSPA